MSRIAEITARRKAITAGEWRVKRIPNPFHSEDVVIQPVPRADVEQICELGTTEGENIMEDAAFIANAPGDIDYLLARVKAADALYEAAVRVEARLRENTLPIVEATSKLMNSDMITVSDKRAVKDAWQWAVYGSAVHLQVFIAAYKAAGVDDGE